jgi:hypothetical protein
MRQLMVPAAVALCTAWACAAPALADDFCVRPNESCEADHEFAPSAIGVQAALDQAKVIAGPDRVLLGAATYTANDGSPFTYVAAPDPVDIVGAGAAATTLTQATTSTGQDVLQLNAGGGPSHVTGLTVQVPDTPGGGSGNTGIHGISAVEIADVNVSAAPAAATSLAIHAVVFSAGGRFDRGLIQVPHGTGGQAVAVLDSAGSAVVDDAVLNATVGAEVTNGTSLIVRRSSIVAHDGLFAIGSDLSAEDCVVILDGASGATGIDSQASASGDSDVFAKHITVIGGPTSRGAASGGDSTGAGHAAFLTVRASILRTGTALARFPAPPGNANIGADYVDYEPGAPVFGGPSGDGGTLTDTHRRTDAPGFVDEPSGDYRLRFDSPLIDAGDPGDPLMPGESATDRSGLARVVDGNGDGSAVRDLGAHEYGRRGPIANATVTPGSGPVGTTFSYTGSGGDPDAGDTLTYSWAFDDGAAATGPTATHAFAAPGSHAATLTVRDSTGLTATAAKSVVVNAPPPLSLPFLGVRIPVQSVRVTRRRVAAIRAVCTAASLSPCVGRLRLKASGRSLGSKRFTIARGAPHKVKVRLGRKAARRLSRLRRLNARAVAVSHDSRNVAVTTKRGVTLLAPKRKG